MNKRKLLLVALSLCMVAILAMGGTLAYLTDTDNQTNVFTVGKVSIVLNEEERVKDDNGDFTEELKDFKQSKKLFPLVGNAQTDPEVAGLPISENYVDKIVTVTNTGSEDAWIRVYFAIPSALDDGYDTFNAGLNILHFNFGKNTVTDESTTVANEGGNWWDWKTEAGNWNYFETTIDDIRYNVYFADYMKTTAENEVTERFLNGVYMDSSFNFNDAGVQMAFNNTFAVDAAWDWSNVTCPVIAIAAQAAGFDTPDDAFDTSFGEQFNPWGGTVENWQE